MDNLLLAFSDVQIRPKVGFAPEAVMHLHVKTSAIDPNSRIELIHAASRLDTPEFWSAPRERYAGGRRHTAPQSIELFLSFKRADAEIPTTLPTIDSRTRVDEWAAPRLYYFARRNLAAEVEGKRFDAI
jgi:hypothetical protein